MTFPEAAIHGPFAGALLFGERTNRTTARFGIYDKDGHPLPYGDIVSGTMTTTPTPAPAPTLPQDAPLIEGPCLFAGLATMQFGHVLINSLGQLWALADLPKDTTLVMSTWRGMNPRKYPHIPTVLATFGVRNPICILNQSARFDEIYTATDLFGERHGGCGSPAFYRWLDDKLPKPAPDGASRLYVSRFGLGPRNGRYACEDVLETLLAKAGYSIFHPQQHSLAAQFAHYQAADQIIFAEGSALHAFSLVRRPHQSVAVIQRRASLPPLIRNQMNDRPGPPVLEIDAVTAIYWPPKRGDFLSVSTLDFDKLGAELCAGGFLESLDDWAAPGAEAVTQSLHAGLLPGEELLDATRRRKFIRHLRRNRRAQPAPVQGETKPG